MPLENLQQTQQWTWYRKYIKYGAKKRYIFGLFWFPLAQFRFNQKHHPNKNRCDLAWQLLNFISVSLSLCVCFSGSLPLSGWRNSNWCSTSDTEPLQQCRPVTSIIYLTYSLGHSSVYSYSRQSRQKAVLCITWGRECLTSTYCSFIWRPIITTSFLFYFSVYLVHWRDFLPFREGIDQRFLITHTNVLWIIGSKLGANHDKLHL